MPKPNPALLPRPALFDVTIADSPIDRRIERVPLEEIELAANARREISQEGIERLAAMLCRTGQLIPCIGHRPTTDGPGAHLRRPAPLPRRQGQPRARRQRRVRGPAARSAA